MLLCAATLPSVNESIAHADQPAPPPPPPPPAVPETPSRNDVAQALAERAGEVRSCTAGSTTGGQVTVHVRFQPSGAVQSVTSTGDEPVVAKCIEQQLRNWSFPAPGEVKQVQIPFVFVRQ